MVYGRSMKGPAILPHERHKQDAQVEGLKARASTSNSRGATTGQKRQTQLAPHEWWPKYSGKLHMKLGRSKQVEEGLKKIQEKTH